MMYAPIETSQQRADRLLRDDQAHRSLGPTRPARARRRASPGCECDACEADRQARMRDACRAVTEACIVIYFAIGLLLWALLAIDWMTA